MLLRQAKQAESSSRMGQLGWRELPFLCDMLVGQ